MFILCCCSWLGRRHADTARAPTDDYRTPRDVATAPALVVGRGSESTTQRTPQEHGKAGSPSYEEQPTDRTQPHLEFQRGAPATARQISYNRLFSQRNAYANIAGPDTETLDVFAKSRCPSRHTPTGRRSGATSYSATDNDAVRRTTSPVSGELDKDDGDWMKALLTDKSRRRQRRRRRTPLPDRISEFYQKLDKLKKEETAPPSKEFHRRWLILTQGVNAALDESSDEEIPELHTI